MAPLQRRLVPIYLQVREKNKTKPRCTWQEVAIKKILYRGHGADIEGELFLLLACGHKLAPLVEGYVLVSIQYVVSVSNAEMAPFASIALRSCSLKFIVHDRLSWTSCSSRHTMHWQNPALLLANLICMTSCQIEVVDVSWHPEHAVMVYRVRSSVLVHGIVYTQTDWCSCIKPQYVYPSHFYSAAHSTSPTKAPAASTSMSSWSEARYMNTSAPFACLIHALPFPCNIKTILHKKEDRTAVSSARVLKPWWLLMRVVLPHFVCMIVVPTCQMILSFERKDQLSWHKERLVHALSAPATGRTAQTCTRFSNQKVCVTSWSMWKRQLPRLSSPWTFGEKPRMAFSHGQMSLRAPRGATHTNAQPPPPPPPAGWSIFVKVLT